MWGNMASKSELTKLQRLQNRCVQTIIPGRHFDSIYNSLGILKVSEMVKLENCKTWFKFYKGILPTKLQSIMAEGPTQETLVKNHGYNTHKKVN